MNDEKTQCYTGYMAVAMRAADADGLILINEELASSEIIRLYKIGRFSESANEADKWIFRAESHIRANPTAMQYLALSLAEMYWFSIMAYGKWFLTSSDDSTRPSQELVDILSRAICKVDDALLLEPYLPYDTEYSRNRSQELLAFFRTIKQDFEEDLARLTSSTESSSDKRCFIATAAYIPDDAWKVDLLRRFRDTVLLPRRTGEAFVVCYYAISPPLARLIHRSNVLRACVRALLDPLVNWVFKYLDDK